VKKLLLLLLLILAAYLLWRWYHRDQRADVADRGNAIFFDRLWVDHLPKSDTDTIQIFAAIRDEPIGIFQKTSAWKGEFELFRHEDKGDGKIVMSYPQSRESERVSYRAWRCDEGRFTFCLDVQGASRGTRRYVSEKDWELGSAHDAAALTARARALLAAPSR